MSKGVRCKSPFATFRLAVGAITVLLMFGGLAFEAQAEVPDRPQNYFINAFNGELDVWVVWHLPNVPTSFKAQWKSGEQDYDSSRQVIVEPTSGGMVLIPITGLTNGVEYTVRVIATNEDGDSHPSRIRTATPKGGPVAEADATLRSLAYAYDFEACGSPTGWCSSRGNFSTDRTAHRLEVRPSTKSVAISTAPGHRRASVAIAPADIGDHPHFHQVSLAEGENVITVTVTAQDGSTTSTHTITVTRPPNTAPTGVPSISGTARVGEKLTASVSGIADEDGMDSATFAYQWMRTDGTTDTHIPGATRAKYTLGSGDQGKTIKVRTTFVDDGGTEEVLTSAATSAVEEILTLSVANAQVRQAANATVDFSVTLSRAASHTVTVDWATADREVQGSETREGIATAGQDYTAASGTVTFGPGETSKTLSIAVLNNTADEESSGEIFALRLSNPVGATIRDALATGTILNDAVQGDTVPPSVSVRCVAVEQPVYHGLQVTDQQPLWWEFHFSENVKNNSHGPYTLTSQNGSEFWGFVVFDYLGSDPSVEFARKWRFGGRPTERGINGVSDVNGVIVSVAAGEWRDRSGNPNTASGTSLYLANNWQVSVEDASGEEGTDETIDFKVTLNARDDCKTVTVDWATVDGTAVAGEDYTAASGTLTFAPGETTKMVSVAVLDDTVEDSGDTFTLQLSNASTETLTGVSLTFADAEATGTIFNHESPFASVPQVDGLPQVGNTLEASFTEAPSGTVTYQWLRGSEDIDGATAGTYAPTAEDVGTRLSVRVASGSDSIASAATAPVWAAPINPPLADGEEELLSTTMTLGSYESGLLIAGYGRMKGQSFGAMDDTAFDDDGNTYAVEQLYVMAGGYLSLATDTRLPAPAGLVAYWNGHRITGLASTGGGGLLVGRTSQPETEYSRYRSGASDGVRVAVSLRRASAAAQDALTAEFLDMSVETHDGSAPFTFEVRFSESFAVSYLTMRDHAFTVTGGRVTGARRIDNPHHEADGMEPNRVWRITVEPEGSADITIALPATTDCTATGAICTADDRPLSAAVTEVVPGEAVTSQVSSTPFAVRFEGVPEEHDGTADVTFQVMFNKEPAAGYSYRTMRDETLVITQGGQSLNAKRAKRLNKPNNDQWRITIAPTSKDDIDVSIVAHTDCSATGAICAEGNEALSSTVSETILGPPGLSVADARVEEGPDATVDFVVTLGRASSSTVTVDYATSDGTATAGSDYTATSGTLTFAAGETLKTVSVPVLDDAHDEGEETFALTLSNPSGGNAWLKDAEATGTIENTDAMPQAWLARFGRTVAEQAIEAIEGRFAASRTPGVEMRLAGERIGSAGAAPENEAARKKLAGGQETRSRLEAMTTWLRGTEAAEGDAGDGRAGYRSRTVTPRDLLVGSSFSVTGGTAGGGTVSLWGRGAVSRFDGRESDLSLDGEVASLMMGADWARDRWTAGLLVSRSVGEGGYRGPEAAGTVESTLTGLFPYGRYELNPRLTVWGIAGYGAGELKLTPEGQSAMRTDMALAMGAVGLRGVAIEAPAEGGVELAVNTDAMAVRTTSEKTQGMAAAEADVTRLRLGLEGTWRGLTLGTGTLAPSAEIGVRHDGGDAETGFGLDLGGGLSWSDPESGLSAEFRGRGLLTHESKGFRDRGLSGSFSWAPGQGSGRGPSLTLTQTLGASASGGADALLGQRQLGALAANDNGAGGDDLANRRLELRFGYGFSAFGDRFTSTPELGLGLSNGHREYTLGWRLGLAGGGTNAIEVRVEATRREATGANDNTDPEHGVGFRATARW